MNPELVGTKAAAHYRLAIHPGQEEVVRLRLSDSKFRRSNAFTAFEKIFEQRKREANEFYSSVIPPDISSDAQT